MRSGIATRAGKGLHLMVTLMDGGMGRELIRRGAASPGGIWSAQALLEAPDAVVDTHRAYIAAGARIVTTNSYSCVPSYLGKVGMGDRFVELAALAGRLARQAADDSGSNVRVAGCLPPLEESYRPDLVVDDDVARPIYSALAGALSPYVDLFLCETMSSIRESLNACEAARAAGARHDLPVFVSWTLNERPGTGLRSGESIGAAFRALQGIDPDAFLFNCTHPDAIQSGVEEIVALTEKPVGGYPNRFDVPGGWTLDGELSVAERADFETRHFVRAGARCVASGATFLGGCCGIGPEDIAALSNWLARVDAEV